MEKVFLNSSFFFWTEPFLVQKIFFHTSPTKTNMLSPTKEKALMRDYGRLRTTQKLSSLPPRYVISFIYRHVKNIHIFTMLKRLWIWSSLLIIHCLMPLLKAGSSSILYGQGYWQQPRRRGGDGEQGVQVQSKLVLCELTPVHSCFSAFKCCCSVLCQLIFFFCCVFWSFSTACHVCCSY